MSGPAFWVGDVVRSDSDSSCSYWSAGYVTGPDGKCHTGMQIGRYLSAHRDRLSGVVPGLNGCFAACLVDSDGATLITDRYATLPVYFARDRGGAIAISDNPWYVVERLSAEPRIGDAALTCLLHAGYVAGNETLISGVETVPPASIVRFRDQIQVERYWSYGYRPEPMDLPDATDALAETFRAVARRSCNVVSELGGRPLLTLSGGLDSRLLAGMFAGIGAPGLASLSYGHASDPEAAVAAEVAGALGIENRVIPVDQSYFSTEFLDLSVEEVGMTTRFTCGTGARHFAKLSGDVLIPGHTGDFISGGHLPPYAGLVGNRDQLHRFLDIRHFRYPRSQQLLKNILHTDCNTFEILGRTTADFDFSEDTFGLIDRWNVENRQRRLILMELRAYERQAPWILPLYDYELVDFFARIPHSLRVGQYLYTHTALERVFAGDAASLGTIRRIGKPLAADHTPYARLRAFSRLPSAFHTPVLSALPSIRDARARLQRKKPETSGPDPIQHWFRTKPDIRDFLTARMREISLDAIDTDQLLKTASQDVLPDQYFHRLVTSAITAQKTLNRARRSWRTRAA